MANMGNCIIELKGITKNFDNQQVLRGIDLNIYENQFLTLLGPSGCGKTTILRIIAGFEEPSKGELLFNGIDIAKVPPYKREINTVFQKYALFPFLNVYDNVAFGLNIKKVDKSVINQKVKRMLSLVGLEGFEKRDVTLLSGGQQQRVAIARAMVKMPKVLLLDEPLSNLDARLRLQTREEIRRIQRETGITTVFVTHDQEEAMSISDVIIVMREGVLQQIGKPQEVYDDPVNLFVAKFLGTPPINLFHGRVKSGSLYIGEDCVLQIAGVANQEVTVGIRPEGFVLQEDGPFGCALSGVEVMGRDISVVSTNSACMGAAIRSIVNAENKVNTERPDVRFSLKPSKVLLFDKDTEDRIRFQAGGNNE